MAISAQNSELNKFYLSVLQDIKSTQLSEEDGGNLEQIFTQYAIDLLADAGETENARVAYDEKALGTANQHKINAYAISDNYETIDLIITIFKGNDEPVRVEKKEIDTAVKRITNFLRKGIYKDYANEIEEASQIFDFVHTLSNSSELKENLVRVNAIILTDGVYPGEIPDDDNKFGYPLYFRVIDLNYLYNITEKSHIPIEIDFKQEGFDIPCIISPSENDQYQSYLAIIPGPALATIYERFGSRLLEQNVRSFLQFTGKINNGIRKTIMTEPHMFLAFNNGIAATAEEVEINKSETGKGLVISKVKDFQIVNGGQTTASIYHTFKKDKANISGIFVQVKLSVVKNREKFSEIVSRISEYANTQNKVSISDLSSNRPFHIDLEKLSRNIFAPPVSGQTTQTKWFYERARGQYKNARMNEGFTKAKQKAFDLKNPKSQMFSKEDLAKYSNTYQEVYDGKKLVIGPHIVVRGNQKNYVQFINYNLIKIPDSIYYEDVIAKTILFRAAEKIYGVKPNSIGDMRYLTVPYAIAVLATVTKGKLDLYKIWRNQGLSEQLKAILYDLMVKVESAIKKTAGEKHGALYGEWTKKEECWNEIKKQDFEINLSAIKPDLEDTKNPSKRRRITDDETSQLQILEELERINSIPSEIWHKIEEWGRITKLFTQNQKDVSFNLAQRVRSKSRISDMERVMGIKILENVIKDAPEILFEIDDLAEAEQKVKSKEPEITLEFVKKIVEWDRGKKKLKDFHFRFMMDVSTGKIPFDTKAKKYAKLNYESIKKYGFK